MRRSSSSGALLPRGKARKRELSHEREERRAKRRREMGIEEPNDPRTSIPDRRYFTHLASTSGRQQDNQALKRKPEGPMSLKASKQSTGGGSSGEDISSNEEGKLVESEGTFVEEDEDEDGGADDDGVYYEDDESEVDDCGSQNYDADEEAENEVEMIRMKKLLKKEQRHNERIERSRCENREESSFGNEESGSGNDST